MHLVLEESDSSLSFIFSIIWGIAIAGGRFNAVKERNKQDVAHPSYQSPRSQTCYRGGHRSDQQDNTLIPAFCQAMKSISYSLGPPPRLIQTWVVWIKIWHLSSASRLIDRTKGEIPLMLRTSPFFKSKIIDHLDSQYHIWECPLQCWIYTPSVCL